LGESDALAARLAQLRGTFAHNPSLNDDPEFIYWDAVLAAREKRPEDAIASLERCILIAPDAPAPQFTLAKLLAQSGALDRAAGHFEASIQAAPDNAQAWLALAQTRLRLGHAPRAERAFSAALELGAPRIEALIGLAHSLEAQKRWAEAFAVLEPHHLDPGIDSQLIRLMVQHAEPNETKEYLAQVLIRTPAHVQATHLLGGLELSAQSARASDAYVRELFDGYASRYDVHMTEQMGYVVHKLLAQRLHKLCPTNASIASPRVLDLGCGTGLLGPELPGYTLTGVDLSQPMLALALGRNYQHLVCAELGGFLSESAAAEFDAIVAADTIIYFGDVSEVMQQSARVLRPGGWLIFNVETPAMPTMHGFEQTPVGRYGHETGYLERLAREVGLVEISTEAIMPRREAGVAMSGVMFSAKRG
jgi:predicted TPR repeat methyltransferase